jgi:hypothetical protein
MFLENAAQLRKGGGVVCVMPDPLYVQLPGEWGNRLWIQILAPALPNSASLGKLFHFLCFRINKYFILQNEDNNYAK